MAQQCLSKYISESQPQEPGKTAGIIWMCTRKPACPTLLVRLCQSLRYVSKAQQLQDVPSRLLTGILCSLPLLHVYANHAGIHEVLRSCTLDKLSMKK